MQKKRNIQSLFRGQKPKPLGGGETKRRRVQYKNRLGIFSRKQEKPVSFLQVVEAARRFEKDPIRVHWFRDLVSDVFIANAFHGNCKKFLEQIVFKSVTSEATRKFAKFWRFVGIKRQTDSLIIFRGPKEAERLLRKFISGNSAKKTEAIQYISEARKSLEAAKQEAYSRSQSLDYPNSSAIIRHGLIDVTIPMILGRIEAIEKIIRTI